MWYSMVSTDQGNWQFSFLSWHSDGNQACNMNKNGTDYAYLHSRQHWWRKALYLLQEFHKHLDKIHNSRWRSVKPHYILIGKNEKQSQKKSLLYHSSAIPLDVLTILFLVHFTTEIFKYFLLWKKISTLLQFCS